MLSKSRYIRGLKCPKSLWLHVNKPQEMLVDDQSMHLFTQGTNVGTLARDFFPRGALAVKEDEIPGATSVERTKALIDQGVTTIYEATFIFNNTLVAVDILTKIDNQWHLFEMKTTTSVKEAHINDAAIQYYVVKGCGLDVADVSVMFMNNGYVRRGELNVGELFRHESVLNRIMPLLESIPGNIDGFIKLLDSPEEPGIEMGKQCNNPYSCDFHAYCLALLPEEDVTDTELLSRTPTVMEEGLKDFMEEISYPLFFLDFETIIPCVPLYDESRPYQQITFQYSLHYKQSRNSALLHYEFLGNPGHDPRIPLIESLIGNLSNPGRIIVYNITFEKCRLKEMQRDFPQYAGKLGDIIERMTDLMPVFRKKLYSCEYMQNSYSIKYVLPALCPGFSYKGLELNNGAAASAAYTSLTGIKDETVISKTRADLLEYCKLDTLAMVKILEVLENTVDIEKKNDATTENGIGETPNLFRFATKELSQDAVISYWLAWADKSYEKSNPYLHRKGTQLLHSLFNKGGIEVPEHDQIKISNQNCQTDILVELYLRAKLVFVLIIEDKIHAYEHSNQLIKYQETIQKKLKIEPDKILGIFLKTGFQDTYSDLGVFKPFLLFDVLELLESDKDLKEKSEILFQYYQILKERYISVTSFHSKNLKMER